MSMREFTVIRIVCVRFCRCFFFMHAHSHSLLFIRVFFSFVELALFLFRFDATGERKFLRNCAGIKVSTVKQIALDVAINFSFSFYYLEGATTKYFCNWVINNSSIYSHVISATELIHIGLTSVTF